MYLKRKRKEKRVKRGIQGEEGDEKGVSKVLIGFEEEKSENSVSKDTRRV